MKTFNIFSKIYNNLFKYSPPKSIDFNISTEQINDNEKIDNTIDISELEPKNISNNLNKNLDFFKYKFNTLINSDVVIRNFIITAKNIEYNASLIFIDGMIDSNIINNSVIKPLMLRNKTNTYNNSNKVSKNNKEIINEFHNNGILIRKIKKFNLADYIYNHLIPQNQVNKVEKYIDAISSINLGNCILLVDTLNIAFNIDAKNFMQRSINTPQNEIVIRGSQEAFVENIRTNTSMLRRIVNNENLVIENCYVGNISRTNVAICYLNNITNNDLLAEVKFRINNLDIDTLLSSGQLEQLIQDNRKKPFPTSSSK